MLDPAFAALFFVVAIGYGILLSVAALLVEELSYHRYDRWRDLGVAVAASIVENVGYRQLHAWWRLQGLWQAIRQRELDWGVMTRSGFATESSIEPTSAPVGSGPSGGRTSLSPRCEPQTGMAANTPCPRSRSRNSGS